MTDTASTAAPAGNTTSTDAAASATASSATADATTTTAPAAVVQADAPTTAEAPKVEAPKAPEKYDFKSVESQVDPAVLSKFEGIARSLNMTQEQATDLLTQLAPEVGNAQKAKQDQMVSQWVDAAKSDKEFGGDKLNENIAIAKKALDTFGSPELTKMLNDTGLGNHPEVIRAFFRAGQKISSGSFVPSGQGTSQAASASSKLYPSMK